MNNICVGGVYPTTNSGNVQVVEYNSATDIIVMFENTGHLQKTAACHIRSGLIKDRSLPLLRDLERTAKEARKERRYYIMDLEGNTSIHKTQRDVCEYLGLHHTTVSRLMKIGDVKGRYVQYIVYK